MEKSNKIRVSALLSPATVQQLDAYADQMSLTRSGAMSVLINQAINQDTVVANMAKLVDFCQNNPAYQQQN